MPTDEELTGGIVGYGISNISVRSLEDFRLQHTARM